MDQTNVIVLIAALSGAIVGAILTAILTYRFSIGQENRKIKREAVEELYELAYRMDVLAAEFDPYEGDGMNWIKPIFVNSNNHLRMRVLTDLNFPSFASSLKDFFDVLNKLEVSTNIDELNQVKREEYPKSYAKLMETLHILVKSST